MSSVFFCKQAQSSKGMPHHIHSYAKHTFEHVGKMTPGLEAFFLFAREEGRQGGREDEGGLSCCRFPNLLVLRVQYLGVSTTYCRVEAQWGS